jgi:serine/threonine-protein kinase
MFALSRSGTLAFIPGDAGPNRTLAWKDRQGVETAIAAGTRPFDEPRLSPDGTQMAVHIADREDTIWIWDFSRGNWRRLRPGRSDSPRWTPDGLRIVYNGATDGGRGIFSATIDGIGDAEPVVAGNANPRSISPDSRWLIAESFTPASGFDLKLIPLHGDRLNGPALNSPFLERWGEVSPDGRWLAYQSNESGRPEIHVRAFPDLDSGHWQVSTSGAGGLHWSRTGHELFFVELTGAGISLVAVPVRADGRTFVAGKPVPLFSMNGYSERYDVAADGRFLMVKDDVANQQRRVVVIENWDQELKTRVPAK